MVGRLVLINILWALVGLTWVPNCLAGSPERPIAVLLSDSVASYMEPVNNFIAAQESQVEVFNLEGDLGKAPAVMREIIDLHPAMIFTLGAKASVAAKTWTKNSKDLPVLFAMVLNWQKYKLLDQDNMAGILSDVTPGSSLANMSIVAPESKRIGVVYSKEHSTGTMEQARQAAAALGFDLVETAISHPKEFKRAYKKMSDRIDSYWILSDPVVFTMSNISWLKKRCIQDKKICIGQSVNVAKSGVLLAVDPDLANMGVQAANIAKRLMSGQNPKQIGVMPPLGTKLILNMKTAEKIGFTISNAAKNMANVIIEE